MNEYEEGAKEVLRLILFFENYFVKRQVYCNGEIEVGDHTFRWNSTSRQFEVFFDERWSSATRIHEMEIPGILLSNIEELYDSCLKEQGRIATVLSDAARVGNEFADKLLTAERKERKEEEVHVIV